MARRQGELPVDSSTDIIGQSAFRGHRLGETQSNKTKVYARLPPLDRWQRITSCAWQHREREHSITDSLRPTTDFAACTGARCINGASDVTFARATTRL